MISQMIYKGSDKVGQPTVTLITGADKGIGFQTAMVLGQLGQVIVVGARNRQKGLAAADKLQNMGIEASFVQLDVTSQAQITQAAVIINDRYGYLSVLINNAGVAMDNHQAASDMPTAIMRKDFDVNFFGVVDVIQAMLPLLKKADSARIINVSSNMGSLSLAAAPDSQFYGVNSLGYQASKAAVNFATISFSKELIDTNITVNSVNPGWTATEFGGRASDAPTPAGMQTVADGAAQIIKVASDPTFTANGSFTENDGTIQW